MKYTEADRGKGSVEEFKFQIFGNLRELELHVHWSSAKYNN